MHWLLQLHGQLHELIEKLRFLTLTAVVIVKIYMGDVVHTCNNNNKGYNINIASWYIPANKAITQKY